MAFCRPGSEGGSACLISVCAHWASLILHQAVACVAAGCVTKSRYSPSAQRLPKACSDTPRMDTRICVFISNWLVCYAPCDWSYSCEISKIKYHRVYNVFFFVQSRANICFVFDKRLKRLCLIRPCIVIYAIGSSKRETKECYSQRDGNNSTSSPRLKV